MHGVARIRAHGVSIALNLSDLQKATGKKWWNGDCFVDLINVLLRSDEI